MSAPTDKIVHWLLSSLEPVSSLFHVGQYCGDWRASTSGCARASFHVVLHGVCWLHFADGRASVPVAAGEAVFLLRDVPHWLSADSAAPTPGQTVERRGAIEALDDAVPGAVGLACGFFDFRGDISHWIVSLLPDYLIVRQGDPAYSGMHAVFELIRAEARRGGELPSPLIDRLVELLLFYAVRDAARQDTVTSGLASLMRRTEFASLIAAVVDAPSETWTMESMAAFSNMSRATFFKRFTEACGYPPAQFVTLMRMKIAGELLKQGWSIPRTAEYVGYRSESAFAHAFKRTTGVQPGAWRRARGGHYTEDNAQMHLPAGAPPHRSAAFH
jgi:AraC family transcriptional regulator, activator of mtrCDE